MAEQVRIFVSYSHQDDAFARRLVDNLQQAGAHTWYDVSGINYGDFMQRIDEALRQCEWLVLVLTPAAVASSYVQMEVNAALHRVQQGYMRAVIPVLAAPCPPNSIPALWDVLHRYDATQDYPRARDSLLRALHLPLPTPQPTPPQPKRGTPAQPPEHMPVRQQPSAPPLPDWLPPRLAELGFAARTIGGAEVIVPPTVPVPAGEFLMGSDKRQDAQAGDNELPQHKVTLPAYQIAKLPVTVAEYTCFVRAGQSQPRNWQRPLAHLDHPVVRVSWREAMAYARWLAKLTGQPWRLPTEAEWEKAARGPDGRIYPWGNAWDNTRANTTDGGPHTTTPVGTYPTGAGPYGALDMAGNVWEWTSTLYKAYPYNTSDDRENVESTGNRVLRGGSWNYTPRLARAADRGGGGPGHFGLDRGFRVLLAAAPGSF